MLTVYNISKRYRQNRSWFVNQYQQVLKPTTFHIKTGQCLGLVGESGSGKSTLARLILGLEKTDSGKITLNQINNNTVCISAVFQDYLSSVNPTMNISEIILEPLIISKIHLINRQQFVTNLLNTVGLSNSISEKYPYQLSGGQLQRVCIARALSSQPQFIVLDEPTSSLDMINQLKILDLLKQLQYEFSLTYLFISHDLQAVTYLCDEIAFFHQGTIVEKIKTTQLSKVKSEYAKKLLLSAYR